MNLLLKKLSKISELITQRSEVIVIFAVIGIIFMMILPLPTGLVDILITLNISVSALMVVLAMYMPGPLAFATFPAMLLVTTLFRMALSITTTRLILLQGDAGQIVEAFGEFVVGGNLVVGLVIFLILTIVNFLVITKGSERVAEVAARFTLDAMPGKQMSIDGDLRAGLLDARQAQQKRADIAKESQLFGAMDGAMKFVKGDAIAGLIIVFVNILGGFSIGVAQLGLPAGEAIKVYSILTIGDGLVAQIPALLISITAGFIITRVSDSDEGDSNVGKQMASELGSEPKAWIIAAIVMVGFSIVPGMPFFAFIFFALMFGSAGTYQIYCRYQASVIQSSREQEEQTDQENAHVDDADVKTLMPFGKLTFCVPAQTEESEYRDILRCIRRARNRIVQDKGYTIAGIEVQECDITKEGCFSLTFFGVPKLSGFFKNFTGVVDIIDNNQAALERIVTEEKIANGSVVKKGDSIWIKRDQFDELILKEVKEVPTNEYVYTKAYRAFLSEAHQFFGIDETKAILAWLQNESESLAGELQRVIPLPRLSEILKALAADEVSIRSVRKIAELAIEYAARERATSAILEGIRVGLGEQICTEYAHDNTLEVLLLEPSLEGLIRKHLKTSSAGHTIELPIDDYNKIHQEMEKFIGETSSLTTPLVVAQDLRAAIKQFLRKNFATIPVISASELPDTFNVVPQGILSLEST